jgi:hypothetical protein
MATRIDHSERFVQAQIDISVLQTQMTELRYGQANIMEQLKGIQTTLSEVRGGWKMLAVIGGIGLAVGGAVSQVLRILL